MKYWLFLLGFAILSFHCTDDPCDQPDNQECLDGDTDNDRIANGEDSILKIHVIRILTT